MRSFNRRNRSEQSRWGRPLKAIVAAFASVLLVSSVLAPAVASADDPEVPVLQIGETASPTTPLSPGGIVTFTYNVDCSSDSTECDNFTATDTIPAPLVIGTVSATSGAPSTETTSGNTFTVKFIQALDDGNNGLSAGVEATFTVTASVPTGVSASYNGQTIANPVTATATNVPTPGTASANVQLVVPTTLAATISKSYSPSTLNSTPNLTTTAALVVNNTSNSPVTTLTVQDPANVSATPNPFLYDGITGLTLPTWPGGANRVEVDYYDGTNWNDGTFASAIALPTGVPASSIMGLRFTFEKVTGGTIAPNSAGTIDIATALRSNVTSITSNTTVANTASAFVTLTGQGNSTTVQGTGDLTIDHVSITPEASKTYASSSIVGGQSDLATIVGTNGGNYTLSSLSVTEPAVGDQNLKQQGLTWGGWDQAGVEWPVGATAATIEYSYYDSSTNATAYGAAQLLTPTEAMPAPTPTATQTTVGFLVDFTGTNIAPNQYATLPFTVDTTAVSADVSETNTAAVDVTTVDGQTAEAQSSATLTERTARVNTSVSKTITPNSIYAVTGASTVVSLPAQITGQPTSPTDTGGSTVGSNQLTVQDPEDPTNSAFWSDFNAAAIVSTAIPSNASLTVNYWNGSAWVALDPATTNVAGPETLTYTLTPAEESAAEGLQFVYTPTSGLFPPGFSVQPNIKAVLRATVRGGSTAPNPTADDVSVDNAVSSTDVSSLAINSPVSANNDASVTLRAVPAGGGIPMIDKAWNTNPVTGLKTVDARSGENRTAVIDWGTGSQQFNSVVITDNGGDPTFADVANSAFDAFNLVSIPAITATMDPYLTYDEISSVQLYIPGTGWTEATNDPCVSNGCDGEFPGLTLTPTQSAAATGVRFTYIESPTRAFRVGSNPDAPAVGSGVAATTDEDRAIDLVFQIRNTRRSNGDPVLGTSSTTTYNGDAPGVVVNTAAIAGQDDTDTTIASGSASDSISILDQPVNVTATKTWLDGPLGVPPTGTPQSAYPTAYMTIQATNVSVSSVDQLAISDPTGGTDPFDDVNLTQIDSITIPSGSTAAQGTVTLAPSETTYTIAQALALSASQLADVTGITVSFTGPIAPGASTTVQVDTQLRPSTRSAGDPIIPNGDTSTTIDNTTTASITDPEVLVQTDNATDVTTDDASASMEVDAYNYGVDAGKSISADTTSTSTTPAIQYDTHSTTATVALSGEPTGNVPTTRMVIEDSTATFWNAFNFNGFNSLTFSAPINTVEVDVLVGVTYQVNGNSITTLCNGSTDLTACWYDGTPSTTLALPAQSPAGPLPAGTTNADIRGIRFTFTKSDYSNWERPHNPEQNVAFTVSRRTTLVTGGAVESDLWTNTTPAPGESQVGVFTNTAEVTASYATGPTDTDPLWSATDYATAQIQYSHLPADVEIEKTPAGDMPLGNDIDYNIAVTNTGSGIDKALTGVVVTDVIPGDTSGPYLVFPNDPDTGQPEPAADAFSYTMTDGATTEPAPTVTATETPNTDGSGVQTDTLTFTLTGSIPLGWTLDIQTILDFRTGLTAGTPVDNTATVTSDQAFDTCDYFNSGVPQTQQTDVTSCESQTITTPEPSAPLTIIKGVRGVAAGPLDPSTGLPLINPSTDLPYNDMGVIKTATSLVNCNATNPALQVDGNGFYTYPCVPITRPGSTEQWASQFTNGGNINLAEVVAIDTLPQVGDTGVILSTSRGSKWQAVLTSYPQVVGLPSDSSYEVEYETNPALATANCNAADIQNTMGMTATSTPPMLAAYTHCLGTSETDDLPNREWQTLSPTASAATLASVVAMKFIITMGDGSDDSGLAPGGALDITYDTQTANGIGLAETTANLGNDSIAWNSIAGAAIGTLNPDELPYPFVSEPRKAGVALATGSINLAKLITGVTSAENALKQPTYNFNVSCLSNGQAVQIFDSTGAPRNPFVVTPGTSLNVEGLPLYSQCTVTEPTDYGETNFPQTGVTVEAEAPSSEGLENVSNPEPAYTDTVNRPAIQTATLTNDYEDATLTINKTITNGGALDGSGNAVVYKSPSFSAVCKLTNGVSTVTTLSATFTLANGGSKSYTVPARSSCTVTETNKENAATTTYALVVNGTPTASGSGTTPAAFALVSGETSAISFTNNYTVGSLNVVKALQGDSTFWAGRSFSLTVTCTNAYTNTSPDYVSTFTLSPATTLSQEIDNLPTGSSCSLVENGNQFETTSVISPAVTIGTTTPVTLTATNTYSDATLKVSKVINSSAVDQNNDPDLSTDLFPMSVACTFPNSAGVATAVWGDGFTASPMTFSLAQGTSESIAGLPAGASCTVQETDAEGADSTTVTTHNSSGTNAPVNGTSATLTLTADNPSPTNTAVITNNYGVTSFTVTKQLAGGGAAQFAPMATGSYSMGVVCTTPGITGDSWDGTILLPTPGGLLTKTISNLPENSTCTVTENDFAATGADAQTFVDSDGGTNGVVESTRATPGSVTVVNWYLTGAISVTKQVDEPTGTTYGDANDQFEIDLSCTRDGTPVVIPGGGDRLVSKGDTEEFDDLPSGSACTVQETDNGGASTSDLLDNSGNIVSDDATTAYALPVITVNSSDLADDQAQAVPSYTIVNSFDATSLVIEKNVDSSAVDQAGNPITYGPFPVTVTCTFDGSDVYATGYSAGSPMQKNLTNGETWTLANLTPGTVCDVNETNNESATSTTMETITGADSSTPTATTGTDNTGIELVQSDASDENFVDITNHYDSGTISLTKDVIGSGASDWGDGPFTINVTCDLTDASHTDTVVWNKDYSISRGDPAIILSDVASGADCTVTETKTGGANSTTIALDGADPTDGTTADFTSPTSAAGTYGIVVTNEFDEATVNVTKVRDGAGAADYGTGPFAVSLVCTTNIDGTITDVTIPAGATRELDATDFYAASYTGLPSGADCTATETTTGGANSTSMTVNAGTTTEGVTAEFTTDSNTPTGLVIDNTFDTGSVSVTKTIQGDGSMLYGQGPFETTIACTYQVDGTTVPVVYAQSPTAELTQANGYQATYNDLPAGASCDVTESKTGGATSHEFTTTATAVPVEADAITPLALTNEFDIGYIKVDNLVTGNDAARHLGDTYDVVLTCTQDIDGVVTPVTIPDGATRDIWHKTTIEYDDLPIGADCSLVESVTNQAQIVTVMWHGIPVPQNSVIVGDPDFTIHVVNVYNVALGYTGVDVTLTLTLGLIALLVGLISVLIPYLRRRRARGTEA